MDAGARGVEIRISGKVTSQRARTQIFRAGTMKKSGQTAQEAVQKGVAQCILKTGVMGIVVKIMKPDYRMGDGIKVHYDELEQLQKQKEAQKAKTKAEEVIEKGIKEGELEIEEEEIFEEVEDEDVKEISLEPELNKEEDL